MNQKVTPTLLTTAVTLLVILAILICFGLVYYFKSPWILLIVVFVLLIAGMLIRLLSVTVDENNLCINRYLYTKKIPMSAIALVKEYPHSRGGFVKFLSSRSADLLGSCGWYNVPGEGKCFAFFNDPKDCILVTLKNGKKYLLACENPSQMAEDILKKIQ